MESNGVGRIAVNNNKINGGDDLRFGPAPIHLIVLNRIDKMDSEIGFEMSLTVVEAIRGRCAGFMIPTATLTEIFGGQTNSSILVVKIIT